ncbi:MAG TPA: aldose 1-epimerase [Acidobacteriaceae bacterium]|nr:aldose 1-epimerase [Acidobacteriaceae bacterium]
MKLGRCAAYRQVVLGGIFSAALLACITGCKSRPAPKPLSPTEKASASLPQVGGQKAIELRRLQSGDGSKPEFLSVTLLPGRGMNMFQITAYLPGRGETTLLASPHLSEAVQVLNNGPEDMNGDQSYSMGGAFLFPFANRILGPITTHRQNGEKFVTAKWHGRTVQLVANTHGKLPGAPLHAMHGQMLAAKAQTISVQADANGGHATAVYHLPADGHWFSDNEVTVTVTLARDTVTAVVSGKNIGQQSEPVGIGWHPYFLLPSGNRPNARLHVPASMRAEVNNYDDVFPTGKLVDTAGTPYDFTASLGAPLPDKLMDDAFVKLKRTPEGDAIAEIRDLGANYGMRVTAMTPLVKVIQVYSPVNKAFIALEPQFNYADPFGSEWHGVDTGMVTLAPGQSTTWKTQLQLFQPADDMVGKPPQPNLD